MIVVRTTPASEAVSLILEQHLPSMASAREGTVAGSVTGSIEWYRRGTCSAQLPEYREQQRKPVKARAQNKRTGLEMLANEIGDAGWGEALAHRGGRHGAGRGRDRGRRAHGPKLGRLDTLLVNRSAGVTASLAQRWTLRRR